jgi:hypothetical protein
MRARVVVVAILVFVTGAGAAEEDPLERLQYILRHMDGRGDVIYQGNLDGFDYRSHLRRAIAKNPGALAALFDYTENGQLIGVGAEQHCEVLYNLLHLWGDGSFARVLRERSQHVRQRVVRWIDSQFLYPGWPPHQFPKTYRLGPHDQCEPKA